ncbi:uncharacterized protein K444DRAFT_622302 [Hyaloscypha bicolor E]|uniref:Uncharacterized protein n=1 Tax=Hyaloscypha bicolor E TaxID=1095630 RepID=A0A2J6SH31_9HELO|nr:uncharacterized protein K444DRAFT_622302 [Hyaloscypha bicolor E]PMD50078.1 hypothetical protein K444DRAFT_622302 [Hyaloscypha bicolor E]
MIDMLRRLDERVDKTPRGPMNEPQSKSYNSSMLDAGSKSITETVIEALNDGRSPETIRIHEELVDCLWNQQQRPGQRNWNEGEPEGRTGLSEKIKTSFQKAIVHSLVFETIQGREGAIPKAFERTYSWIFQREPGELDGKQLWSSFPDWLENSTDQPYWITGKPGSGKSTLMKYILQHRLLKPHLQKWADNFALLITSYYAWVAGSDLQKSCEGLVRTLLYQVLQLNPSLVPEVAPRRWSLFLTLRRVTKMPPWQRWELEESFEVLLSKCGRTMRLALFIDGLDEFESPPLQVLELIQHINDRNGIKVCVASRQWTEFNDAFNLNPMLRMQELTTADMAHFVGVKFEGNRGFLELKTIFPTETARLVGDVVRKADGVFLWVSLVVKSLLEALTEGDGLVELQETVDQLPIDIAQLYDAILSRISSRNVTASSKLLVTFKTAVGPLSYLTLWLSDEKQSLNCDINSLFPHARSGIVDIMKRRLDSKTRGILEISPDGTVNFLHRTARDWALQPSVWEGICSRLPEGFDPYLLLLRAETIRLPEKANLRSNSMGLSWDMLNKSIWYASQVEDSPTNASELVRVLSKLNSEASDIAEPYLQHEGSVMSFYWPSTQEATQGIRARGNTFLGLMSQFCVLPYLKVKLEPEQNATKLKLRKNCTSLLENAVFGYPGINDPSVSSSYRISSSQRLETVSFLLERGFSPKEVMLNGNVIINEVRKRREKERYSESREYWAEVEKLLGARLGSKWRLKSLFGRKNDS